VVGTRFCRQMAVVVFPVGMFTGGEPRGSMATGGPESQDCQAFAQGHNRRACEARVEAFAELAPFAC